MRAADGDFVSRSPILATTFGVCIRGSERGCRKRRVQDRVQLLREFLFFFGGDAMTFGGRLKILRGAFILLLRHPDEPYDRPARRLAAKPERINGSVRRRRRGDGGLCSRQQRRNLSRHGRSARQPKRKSQEHPRKLLRRELVQRCHEAIPRWTCSQRHIKRCHPVRSDPTRFSGVSLVSTLGSSSLRDRGETVLY